MDKGLWRIVAVMVLCGALLVVAGMYLPNEWVDGAQLARAEYVRRFFPADRVIDIDIRMDPADLEDMLANPLREEYKPADVIIDGVHVSTVGVRTKGNSSLMSVANSASNRYSFKIDFNQYIDAQTLWGLTKLNLNNSFSDPSFMREYLSYQLLSAFGIPTPAVGYANVYLNGELWGLYVTVEGVEEPMLRRYFGNNYGTLYKADTGATLVYDVGADGETGSGGAPGGGFGPAGGGAGGFPGRFPGGFAGGFPGGAPGGAREGTSDQVYTGLRRMTDERPGAQERLMAMLKSLNSGTDLERYLNVDQILRYFAVNTVLVNMDSYVGNFAHNYYLYEQDGVFTILPWDYNMSFGGFGGSVSLSIDMPLQGGSLASRPLLGQLLAVDEYKERYHRYIEEFISGPFALERMEAEIARIATMIAPHVEKDPTKFYTYEQFLQAVGWAELAAAQGSGDGAAGGAGDRASFAASDPSNRQAGDVVGPGIGGVGAPAGQRMGAPFAGGQRGPGLGFMMGSNSMSLLTFIAQRIDHVKMQLSGEMNSAAVDTPGMFPGPMGAFADRNLLPGGDLFGGANFPGFADFPDTEGPRQWPGMQMFQMPAEPGGQVPPVPGGQMPPMPRAQVPQSGNVPGMQPPGGNQVVFGGGGRMGPGAFAQPAVVDPVDPAEQLYTFGGSLLLLVGAIVVVMRRRTNRSI